MVVLCICSCTSEYNIFDNNNTKLLNFTVSVPSWKNNDSTSNVSTRAAPISETSLDESNSFNIIADVYDGKSSYSNIIDKEAVSFTNNMWQTTVSHYWSGTANNTVNFYAYYPTTISSSITHTAGSAPSLSYTVPNDAVNQIDIMTATSNNVSGSINSSTPLTFNHIFAAVKFSVGTSGLPSGTVKTITVSGINNSGTYTFGSGWALGSSTSTFTVSPSTAITGAAGANITSNAFTMMMIPQTFSNATITLAYSNGTTFSTTISGTWNAGRSYTYNLSKTIIYNYDYTGASQTFTTPYTGTYKIECWGAQGGYAIDAAKACGGYGGMASGGIYLTKGTCLYIVIGGQGGNVFNHSQTGTGGYNGGGTAIGDGATGWGGGGGATHIATVTGLLSTLSSQISQILIIAGGGGGGGYYDNTQHYPHSGGDGGGINGNDGSSEANDGGAGGTQMSGFTFGLGQNGKNSGYGSGGGGGYYGGYSGYTYGSAAGGGSGYLGTSLIIGTTSMNNGVRSGNGYARITFISAN